MFTRKWKRLIGFPVKNEVEGSGKIRKCVLPGGRYVKTIHQVPYQKVGETCEKLTAWIKQNNIVVAGESMEIYPNDPRKTKKENLETIVLIPIRK